MIHSVLVDTLKEIKRTNNLTYTDMTKLSELTRSQVILIERKGGVGVSVERMEKAINNLGWEVEIEFKEKED